MSTIAQQLQELAQIKESIRQAIIAKGVTVASDAAFADYATAIAQISGGGGSEDLINVIERAGTSLTIPGGLTKIGQYALSYMPFTSLVIPSGVTQIQSYAIQACTSLEYLDLPASLTSIGNSGFLSTFGLKTIICRATTPPTTNANSFGNNTNNYAGKNVSGTKTLYVPRGYTSAYQSATNGWAVLLDSTKCGFSIAELDANGNIPT